MQIFTKNLLDKIYASSLDKTEENVDEWLNKIEY